MKGVKIIGLMLALAVAAGAALAVEDVIIIRKTGHRKPRIRFNHRAHIEKYDTECIDCHHTGTQQKCSRCHTMRDRGAVINIKGAYHQQCHDCHRKTSGPKACGRCHTGNRK